MKEKLTLKDLAEMQAGLTTVITALITTMPPEQRRDAVKILADIARGPVNGHSVAAKMICHTLNGLGVWPQEAGEPPML